MMKWRYAIVALLWLLATIASAHMPTGYDLRAVHFEHRGDGIHAFYRLSLPLVLGAHLGAADNTGFATAAPFTIRRIESAHAFYYVDIDAVNHDITSLAKIALDRHTLTLGQAVIRPTVQSARVYPKGFVPPFGTLEQARAASAPGEPYPRSASEVEVAYALIDVHALYPHSSTIDAFDLSSTLDNRLIGQTTIQTVLVDHRDATAVMYRRGGSLTSPIAINPSMASSMLTFARDGVGHIGAGIDHLLFIVCLTLGATSLSALLWRVSGFTVGHAITVSAAFFGYTPNQNWFGAAIEVAIALSILWAALTIMMKKGSGNLLWLAIVIGVIHGFGFSVALNELLQRDGPNPWSSLLGFNVGVELAQIAVAGAVWAFAATVAHFSNSIERRFVFGTAAACAIVGIVWIVQRTQVLIALQG